MAPKDDMHADLGSSPEIVDPDPTAAEDYEVGLKSLNQWQLAWRKFRKHKLALIGLGLIFAFIAIAVIDGCAAIKSVVDLGFRIFHAITLIGNV